MSHQHSTTAGGPQTEGFSSALNHVFALLIHQLSHGYQARRIEETRRATRREIAGLPAGLQQDLAFSDGTIFTFGRQ